MPETRKPKTKEWTVMFYFASDNPLAPGTIAQLKAIKNAGYHPDTNVVAQFDPHTVNMPVHVFDVNMVEKLKYPGEANIGFSGKDPFVRNLVLDKLWDKEIKAEIQKKTSLDYDPPVPPPEMSKEQNPKDSLKTFLEFCSDNYPARHYILFVVGHGIVVGNDLFMYDEHGPRGYSNGNGNATANPSTAAPHNAKKHDGTGNGNLPKEPDPPQSSLLLTDLGEILGEFKTRIGKGEDPGDFELIGFHSCSMSGVEVALELKGTANYMLASQGPTFVGSWPYRNILIRLFNDVGSNNIPARAPAKNYLVACGLVDRLKTGDDPVSKYLQGRLNGHVGELSQDCIERDRELIKFLVSELDNPELCQVAAFPTDNSPDEVRELATRHRAEPLKDAALRRLNRFFLEENYEKEMKSVQIKHMLTKIFYYYMYNSFDFQLAGYSCDLTLCDLNKVGYLQTPLDQLAAALIKGLDQKDRYVREAILLAHWEAQSFYEENYIDLYDFCFRLKEKFKNDHLGSELPENLKPITHACVEVMKVLRRGSRGDDYGPIVRSEFCGPLYQYSHGLSVFFPWSEPVDNQMWDEQYSRYKLNQDISNKDKSSQKEKEICWKKFLEKYFDETMRDTQQDEKDELETQSRRANLDEDLLGVLQYISTRVFADGHLGSGGPRDPMGNKGGGLDPTGSDCECGTIKNYPRITGRHLLHKPGRDPNRKPEKHARVASPDVIRQVTTELIDKIPEETLFQVEP